MQNNKKYLNGICDETIKDYLKASGAVIIKSPKWCDKSATAKQFVYMQDETNKDILKLEEKEILQNFLKKTASINSWVTRNSFYLKFH